MATLIAGLAGGYGPDPDTWTAGLGRLLEQHFEGLFLRARGC